MQANRLLILNAFHSLERDTLEREVFAVAHAAPPLFSAQSGFDRLCREADPDFIVSVYGLGIAGLLLRIGTNMLVVLPGTAGSASSTASPRTGQLRTSSSWPPRMTKPTVKISLRKFDRMCQSLPNGFPYPKFRTGGAFGYFL